MADIRELGTEGRSSVKFSEDVFRALNLLKERFVSGKPRELRVTPTEKPFLLFTDGAYEPDQKLDARGMGAATIGGVLFDRKGNTYVFGRNVDPKVLEGWLEEFQHPIGLIELYAVAVAYKLWGHMFAKRRIVLFGDNWAANDVFVKGTSNVKAWRSLLIELEKLDEQHSAMAWMARVPSASNVADPPSRGSMSELPPFCPCIVKDVTCPITGNALHSFLMAEADKGTKQLHG